MAASSGTLGWKAMVLVLLVASLPIAGIMHGCVPASQRLAAPVVCPDGTREAVVVAYWTGNSKGGKSFRADLHCVDAEGGGREPGAGWVFLVLAGYVMAALGLVVVVRRLQRRGTTTLLAIVATSLAGCTCGTVSREEFAARWPYAEGPVLTRAGIGEIIGELERRVGGPVRVTSVSLSPSVASFTVQDPRRPANLDQWTWVNGAFRTPEPERTSDSRPFEDDLFDLRGVALADVSQIVARATTALALEGGRVTGLSVSRSGERVEIRASVQGTRKSGGVRFDAAGTVIEARTD